MIYEAFPAELQHRTKEIGPCMIAGCRNRATTIVTWEVTDHVKTYGELKGWYCDSHAPVLGADVLRRET